MEKAADFDCPFAKFYMEKIGWCLDGSNIGIGLCDEASGTLTFNAGRIGLTDDRLFLEADIRYPVTYSEEEVLDRMEKAVSSHGVKINVITSMDPVYMDKDGEVIKS